MSNKFHAIVEQLGDCADSIEHITNGISGHSSTTPKIGKKFEDILLKHLTMAKKSLEVVSSYFERKK